MKKIILRNPFIRTDKSYHAICNGSNVYNTIINDNVSYKILGLCLELVPEVLDDGFDMLFRETWGLYG